MKTLNSKEEILQAIHDGYTVESSVKGSGLWFISSVNDDINCYNPKQMDYRIP